MEFHDLNSKRSRPAPESSPRLQISGVACEGAACSGTGVSGGQAPCQHAVLPGQPAGCSGGTRDRWQTSWHSTAQHTVSHSDTSNPTGLHCRRPAPKETQTWSAACHLLTRVEHDAPRVSQHLPKGRKNRQAGWVRKEWVLAATGALLPAPGWQAAKHPLAAAPQPIAAGCHASTTLLCCPRCWVEFQLGRAGAAARGV